MDSGTELKITNPKTKANLISKLFFTWSIKFFYKLLKQGIQLSDLFKVLLVDDSELLGNKLEVNWNKEVEKSTTKNGSPSLLKAIMATFLKSYMVHGIILFFQHVFLRTSQPLILAYIISLFGKDEINNSYLCLAAGLLVVVTFVIVLTMHHTNFGQAAIGMRIRVALSSLVYRKTLRLSKAALNEASVGQIVNLLSNDVTRFDFAVYALHYIWILPFQAVLITFLCWQQIGISCLVGVISISLLSLPLQGYLGNLTSLYRVKVAQRTDTRVTIMSEIISGIQVIKMYAWEKIFQKLVNATRMKEVDALTVTSYLRAIYLSFMIFIERTALFLTLAAYTLSGNPLLAEHVFSITQFFNLLQLTMSIFYPLSISYGAEALVSLKRIQKFMLLEENRKTSVEIGYNQGVTLKNVYASWTPDKVFLKDINFTIPQGSLCAIVGKVGSGKSSILNLVLSELTPRFGSIQIQGSVSFASQEPWLFGSTIRNNILFGEKYDRRLYQKVAKVCALQNDFKQFILGDKTLVGERGATLSGGQRARVNLARAVYRNADIYLLDDPLSAVDIHVGKHLFEECILKYLRKKTRILVTHRIQYLQKADLIIVMNNGAVEAIGTYNNLSQNHLNFVQETESNNEETEQADDKFSFTISDNSILNSIDCENETNEQEETGMRKGSQSLLQYIKSSNNTAFNLLVICLLLLAQIIGSSTDFWVTYWTQKEAEGRENIPFDEYDDFVEFRQDESRYFYLYVYLALIVTLLLVTFTRSLSYFKLAMIISKNLHYKMFESILHAPMSFFNTNPAGRVLNRFSKDLGAIDELLPRVLLESTQIFLILAGICIMVIVSNYYLVPVTLILGFCFIKIRSWFVSSTKELKHLEGITKSPMFSHLNSSIHGITTIRAFNSEATLQKEFDICQDVHTSVWFLLITTTCSFGLWLDLVCVIFITCTSFSFAILHQYTEISSSLVGLAISQSLMLTGMLQYGVRQSAEVVNQLTSVERVLQYTEIEKEEPLITKPENEPTKLWPQHGFILIEQLYLRYSPNKPPVLKNINIEIQSGEKIGIVGRTGAGKSSLISALFRLSDFSGSIYIDGIDTKKLGVQDLRKKLSIIPQEPVLFSTTLRENLDPFNEFGDFEVWNALEEVEMKDVVSLDMKVARNGLNFSIGQRQLICLARAILKNNKILVLDEATANTDDKTDELIQRMIRKKFKSCTVLTVAHRLHTVMDSDKIMVLQYGEVIEYDHPHLLLQQNESALSRMVSEGDDETSESLTKMAHDAYFKKQV